MNLSKIISEEINKCINSKCMLREYKNPRDAETVRACRNMLQNLYNNSINNGMSRHEITMENMAKIISDLERLEQVMDM
jgi:hypothetical protein